MPWILLVIAGLLEAGWAIGLKRTEGFTRLVPSVWTVAAIMASLYLLARAAQTLPIGTAYAVWVGIGALGTMILGSFAFGEPLNTSRIFFALMLLVSIIGLKVTAP